MKNLIIVISIGFLFYSCFSTKPSLNTKELTMCFLNGKKTHMQTEKRTYSFFFPENYTLEEDHGDHHDGVICIKNDTLKFYFYNTIWDYPRYNEHNKMYCNVSTSLDMRLDSMFSFGKQKNGLLWKEKIKDDFVMGYINVSPREKENFDSVIRSLKLIKKRKCNF